MSALADLLGTSVSGSSKVPNRRFTDGNMASDLPERALMFSRLSLVSGDSPSLNLRGIFFTLRSD